MQTVSSRTRSERVQFSGLEKIISKFTPRAHLNVVVGEINDPIIA